jgi:hypothetical protein
MIVIKIILLIILTSCEHDKSKVQIFNKYYFELSENEKVKKINLYSSDIYKKFFKYEKYQIPLFKNIHGQDYEYFIGIPFENNIDSLKSKMREKKVKEKYFEKEFEDKALFIQYKTDSTLLFEFITKKDSSFSLYVSGVTNDINRSNNNFSAENIYKRIIKDE